MLHVQAAPFEALPALQSALLKAVRSPAGLIRGFDADNMCPRIKGRRCPTVLMLTNASSGRSP